MRVLKRILIALGSAFLLLVVLIGWVGMQSLRFKRQETHFVESYVKDLSRQWNVADVYDRSESAFIAQASSMQGRRALQSFKSLGRLTAVHDLELRNFFDGTAGRRGVFDFRADFQNGTAQVEVTVIDGRHMGTRVLGINLSGIQTSPSANARISI